MSESMSALGRVLEISARTGESRRRAQKKKCQEKRERSEDMINNKRVNRSRRTFHENKLLLPLLLLLLVRQSFLFLLVVSLQRQQARLMGQRDSRWLSRDRRRRLLIHGNPVHEHPTLFASSAENLLLLPSALATNITGP